jgi:hypothetical protein
MKIIKIYTTMFLIGLLALSNPNSHPQDLEQNDTINYFQTTLGQAKYGEKTYEERIKLYQELLENIESFQPEQISSYVEDLQGFFNARQKDNPSNLSSLKTLVIQAKENQQLHGNLDTLESWISSINEDLTKFALHDGDIVKIKTHIQNGTIAPIPTKSKKAASILPVAPNFSDKNWDETLCSSLFKIKTPQLSSPVYEEKNIELIPLFAVSNGFAYPLPSDLRLSIANQSRRGKGFYYTCIANPSNKKICDAKSLFTIKKNNNKDVTNQWVPILPNDRFKLVCNQLSMKLSLVNAQEIKPKPIRSARQNFRKKDFKPNDDTSLFFFEKLTNQEFAKLTDKQIDTNLYNAIKLSSFSSAVSAYDMTMDLLNSCSTTQKHDAFYQGLYRLFHSRKTNNPAELKKLRSFLAKAVSNNNLENKRPELENFVWNINNELIPLGLKYGDVVSIASNLKNRPKLWTHGASRFQSGNHLEIAAGLAKSGIIQDGASFFKIKSPQGKTGIIQYDDPIELSALFSSGGTKQGTLGMGEKLWVNTSSYCGKKFYEVLVGPNSCLQANNGQELFTIKIPPQQLKSENIFMKKNPILSGDMVEIWSKAHDRKLWINQSSLDKKGSHDLLAGPNDDDFNGINRTQNGQQLFVIEKVQPETISKISDEELEKKLSIAASSIEQSEKINAIQSVLPQIKYSEYLSQNAKEHFTSSIQNMFDNRKSLDKKQQSLLCSLMEESIQSPLEKHNLSNLGSWLETIKSEVIENKIFKKLKSAENKKTVTEKIKKYNKITQILAQKQSDKMAEIYIKKLSDLSKEEDLMNSHELLSMKNLIDQSLQLDYKLKKESNAIAQIEELATTSKNITFKAQIKEIDEKPEAEKIAGYKEIVNKSEDLNNHEQLMLVQALKCAFESKVNEINAIKKILELANQKITSKNTSKEKDA